MRTKNFTKFMFGFVLSLFLAGSANAQFNDWKPYPLTTTKHESKDSSRAHVWGYVFGSAYTKLHADSINKQAGPSSTNSPNAPAGLKTGATQYSQVPNGFNAMSFQRVYLGFDYFFNNKFSAHMVLAHEEFYDGLTTKDNLDNVPDRIFYLKYCNFEWANIFKGSTLSVGSIVTPAFPITEEPIWGYRSLERTIMDMRGIVGSSDLGVNLGGKFWKMVDASGMEKAAIGYNIMVGNNSAATPDNSSLSSATSYKRYYGDVFAKFLNDKIVVDLYADQHTINGSSGDRNQSNLVYRGIVAYKAKNYNISVEYFQEAMKDQSFISSGPDAPAKGVDTTNRIQAGFSVEGALTLIRDKVTNDQKLGIVARFDMYNPDTKFKAADTYSTGTTAYKENFAMFAVDYQPIKQIHIMPNIWYDGFTDGANGVSGLRKSDNDLVARVTFYFLFYK